jgi:hypothetical protein
MLIVNHFVISVNYNTKHTVKMFVMVHCSFSNNFASVAANTSRNIGEGNFQYVCQRGFSVRLRHIWGIYILAEIFRRFLCLIANSELLNTGLLKGLNTK